MIWCQRTFSCWAKGGPRGSSGSTLKVLVLKERTVWLCRLTEEAQPAVTAVTSYHDVIAAAAEQHVGATGPSEPGGSGVQNQDRRSAGPAGHSGKASSADISSLIRSLSVRNRWRTAVPQTGFTGELLHA